MIDDATLLARYARDRSEEAFAELVGRHLTLVYSAALRRTEGDAHRAEDVSQIVFTGLARDAAKLSRHPTLVGWLYAATRNAAIDIQRAERRRREREQKAHHMENISSSPETSIEWERLRPVLDDAMDELEARDREAVLLRFFEGRPFASVAAALRVSEDAARKRVDRALEKLGALLGKRGITSTGGALALLLANQVAVAAPASVATSITAAALAGAGTATGAAGILIMSMSKLVTGVAGIVALLAVGIAFYQNKTANESTAALVAAKIERANLQSRLTASEKHAREIEETLASVRKDLSDLRAQPPAPPPAGVSSKASTWSIGPAMEYVFGHPELQATYVQQQGLRAKLRYERFVKDSGLSAAQQEQFFKTLEEGFSGEVDVAAILHDKGYGVGNLPWADRDELRRIGEMNREYKDKWRANLRAVLGDDGLRKFDQYSGLLPDRNVAEAVASQVYDTDVPLTASQTEQLTQILKENPFKPGDPSPSNTMGGDYVLTPRALNGRMNQVEPLGGMTRFDWQNPITDAALAQARSVLNPTQFAALQRMQAQQVTQFKLAPPPATTPVGK